MPDPRTSRRSARRTGAVLFAATLFAACASGPYTTKLMVEGSDQLNPTFDEKPSAVPIRIVQLKDKQAFLSATEEELFGEDLRKQSWVIAYQEGKVRVSLEREIEIEIQPEVRFLGIVGMFNETDGDWKAVIDCGDLDDKKLVFDGYRFSAEPRDS